MDTERDPYANPYILDPERPFAGCMPALLLGLLCLAATLLLSCRTREPVVLTQQHHHVAHQHDTLLRIDSVLRERETIIREADPLQIQELGIQLRQNERAILVMQRQLERQTSQKESHVTDTVVRSDTIRIPVPVPAPQRRASLRQRLLTWLSDTAISIFALVALAGIVQLFLARRKK